MTRIAHDIVIDHVKHEIRMDGVVFPFHIAQDYSVETLGSGHLAQVNVGILADNVTIITADGHAEGIRTTTPAAERQWAQLAGRDAAVALAVKLGLLD